MGCPCSLIPGLADFRSAPVSTDFFKIINRYNKILDKYDSAKYYQAYKSISLELGGYEFQINSFRKDVTSSGRHSKIANALSITKVTNSKIPILLDNCYTAQEDTDNNVNYHSGSFTTNVSSEDDIYIDCTPVNYETTDKTTTILQEEKNNKVLDAGASIDRCNRIYL